MDLSGVLPYLSSRADAFKRQLNDIVSNPKETMQRNLYAGAESFAEDPTQIAGPHGAEIGRAHV